MAESGPGKINLFLDCQGQEIPVAVAVATTAAAGYYHQDFQIRGDLADTDAGVVALAVSNGASRLTGTDEDTLGCAYVTDTAYSPVLHGPITIEARVNPQALTARELFIGVTDAIADNVISPLTYVGATTATLTASDFAGFFLASELTATANWHAVYNGGTTTGPTTVPNTGVTAVAGEYNELRLEIDTNGTCRWWIDGNLEQTVVGAVSTTVLQGVIVGCFANTTTVTDLDVDYVEFTANRDWTK